MKTFKLEIPDCYENGIIGITLVPETAEGSITSKAMVLDGSQEIFFDGQKLEVRSPEPATAEKPHWTPVTDDLPDKDDRYFVTVQKYDGDTQTEISRYQGTEWFRRPDGTLTHWAIETGELFTVLAWMELPPRWEG